jgi:DUF1707 SHOCT-like domain
MHRKIKEMHRKNETPEIVYPNFQAALDAAIRSGPGTRINIYSPASAVVPDISAVVPEKVLLPKSDRAVVPEGVHLLSAGTVRIGDADRDIYLNRLREALGGGNITESEFDARQTAILAAESLPELDLLTRDLPKDKEPAPAKREEEHVPPRMPDVMHFLLSVLSIAFPLISGIGFALGGSAGGSAILAFIGGIAGLLLVIFGGRSR